MKKLAREFNSRTDLVNFVKALCPWTDGDASPILGGRSEAEKKLSQIDPIKYAKTRNYGDGAITSLSPYIRHGILSLNEVRHAAFKKCSQPQQAKVFLQELAWRDYWQYIYAQRPEWIWQDIEDYKTGFRADEYADHLPEDIKIGQTGVACLDEFIRQLITTGYLHNHARMYLASYVVHFRRIKWQCGAAWFLEHLVDADHASNNLSWQWIASTFSNKPYIFNLENVATYFPGLINLKPEDNLPIAQSYETLQMQLFPHLNQMAK